MATAWKLSTGAILVVAQGADLLVVGEHGELPQGFSAEDAARRFRAAADAIEQAGRMVDGVKPPAAASKGTGVGN
jgi:hypothetical protein